MSGYQRSWKNIPDTPFCFRACPDLERLRARQVELQAKLPLFKTASGIV